MARNARRWTLERLVDFEQAAATPGPKDMDTAVTDAIRGLEGATARREGFSVWLEARSDGKAGGKFTSALSLIEAGLATLTLVAGITAVIGLLDPARGGINVSLFLTILIGGQWLVLVLAAVAWLFRQRAADGFSAVQALAGRAARGLSTHSDLWWGGLVDGGGAPRAALLWRLARIAQTAGIFFNIGILCGLAGLVLVKHVGFFWETTTELAMRSGLETTVRFLSVPWSSWLPGTVPDGAVIDASRWLPGRTRSLDPGPAAWWEFLLMATLVWGLAPRAILWLLAWQAGRRGLTQLDFQGRHHRALWREITGTHRMDSDSRPLDGVLVLDVGGSGLTEDSLRPFLLRRLRVHPTTWKSVAVLDAGAELEATRALAGAPAGIVLLAEGWALSPPRMIALHRKVRATAGDEAPVKFLVANVGTNRHPVRPTDGERREWERFVDSLRDPAAEIHFFDELQPAL